MDRRRFLIACAALGTSACSPGAAPLPGGSLLWTGYALGHRLRDGRFPAPSEVRRRAAVIAGAGVAGVSAAWRFAHAGFSDYELLELEPQSGGNARWGENEVSRFPWGAHYLPLPGPEARATRRLLAELGVLQGDWRAERPRYDERALCAAPQERLYRHGYWSEGLAPLAGAPPDEKAAWERFHERMAAFKSLRGADGRRAFALPLEHSSRDAALLELDRISMREWLAAEKLDAPAVRWMVDYACRDDYGCSAAQVSAWAGIHYFASRDAQATNADGDTVLTWPEGNGWLLRGMLERARPATTHSAIVFRAEQTRRRVAVDCFLPQEDRSVRIEAEQLIWAAPLGFAAFVLAGAEPSLAAALRQFDYAPWLVANLTLEEPPSQGAGAPLAWDNVLYDSPSLGYVVATHQRPGAERGPTVLTYYWPLADDSASAGRKRLLDTPRERWAEAILADLERPHPGLRRTARRLDVLCNGHAMVRPRPGVVWGPARARVLAHPGRVQFAHSDASGLSLFEEAQYRGIAAAERALAALGGGALPTFL